MVVSIPIISIASSCRKHLKQVILNASGFTDNILGIDISSSPKEEAAYGLVAIGYKT